MKWGPEFPERHDLSSLGLLGTDGEPINPKAWLWYLMVIGHIMISPLPAITDTKPGSATRPRPGIGAAVLDESSGEDAGTEQGLLVLRRPWPGMLRTLYRTRTASSRPTGTSSASTPTRSPRRP